VSRQQRQRDQIQTALRRGQHGRVVVLSREHLLEFPDDADVREAAEQAARATADRVNQRSGPRWRR
jgi:hypothetical protein